MHDVKAHRDDPGYNVRGWTLRGVEDAAGVVEAILDSDRSLRAAQTTLQAAQSRRNEASKLIGQAKARKDEATASALMGEVETLKEQIQDTKAETTHTKAEQELRIVALPNPPAADVPVGPNEQGNVEVRRWGE